jgi:hypothetical protein
MTREEGLTRLEETFPAEQIMEVRKKLGIG